MGQVRVRPGLQEAGDSRFELAVVGPRPRCEGGGREGKEGRKRGGERGREEERDRERGKERKSTITTALCHCRLPQHHFSQAPSSWLTLSHDALYIGDHNCRCFHANFIRTYSCKGQQSFFPK